MSLSPGSRFGSFEVQSKLGAGGMGEVFRARDTRLGRDVALKVLPAASAGDRERLEWLTREARALAALNHPGIASIYDTVDVDGIRALVLEFIEGVTLEERLRAGAIPMREAFSIANAVAEALDSAHDRGMVHRDLKPANIKITPDGTVKLLDFGIARMASGGDATTLAGTGRGVIVGTAAYMSPEQARGQAVDKRADVWAFGCVLFEMLTGRAVFGGESWSDSIARTLTSEPDWNALPAATPPSVLGLLRRCLRKDPKERLRGLGGLELVFEQADAPELAAVSSRRPIAIAAATVAVAMLAGGAWWLARRPALPVASPTPVRFEIPPSVSVGEAGSFALSPDGTRIVFIGTGADRRFRMWERSLESLETTPISGTEGEVANNTTLFWSPDGRSIGFYADGAVRRINHGGGVAEIVCRVPGVAVGGSWNAAGDIVVGNTSGGLVRCPAAGGEATFITIGGASGQANASQDLHLLPVFLRDGQRLLYLRVSRTEPSGNGLFLADLRLPPEKQSTTRIVETGFSAKYVVSDAGQEHILFVRNRNIWSIAFDSDRVATIGEPVQIASSVYTFRDGASFDASKNLFVYRGGAPDYQMVWRNRAGKEIGRSGESGMYSGLALSPDATRVALTRENKLNRSDQDLWIVDVGRNTMARFTSDAFPESVPEWSADGQSVIYAAGHDDADVRAKPLSGAERTVLRNADLKSGMFVNPLLTTFSASRDGRWLTVTIDTRARGRSDIWILDLRTGGKLTPLIEQDFDQRQAALSPNGRWLAYVSNESGSDEVLLRPMTWPANAPPTAGAAMPISRGGARSPRWRGDSGELFYHTLTGGIVSVTMAGGAIGEATPLFAAPGALAEWGVASDGQRFLLAMPTESRDLPFTLVMNWLSPPKTRQ
jgi:eukaryotic-like serine/threonine-protein kinase